MTEAGLSDPTLALCDSVVELARRNAENLHETLIDFIAKEEITIPSPSKKTLQKWIDQAKTLPRVQGR